MSSYVIAGASRGIGFEFLRQLSEDSANTVIGLVRNKAAVEKQVVAELNRPNIHILHGDLADYESLKKAAEDTAALTGGSIDYVIANGAFMSHYSAFKSFGVMAKDPKVLSEDIRAHFETNVIGNIHLFNLFLPLLRRGTAKKAIAISTGMADLELISKHGIDSAGPYSMSKAALNIAVAKFHAEYEKEGILFMTISPGMVDTQQSVDEPTEEARKGFMRLAAQFASYAPHFAGPISAEESVKSVLSVIQSASLKRGFGGSFVSHHGNKQWI
ncbi:NAD(P)-binding protein [Xylariaceae sp. FL0662B]|nr:NAD(P)-binding protein [Xylariaceae sp. FL0662B]